MYFVLEGMSHFVIYELGQQIMEFFPPLPFFKIQAEVEESLDQEPGCQHSQTLTLKSFSLDVGMDCRCI